MIQKKTPAMKSVGSRNRILKGGKHEAIGTPLPDVRGVSPLAKNAAVLATQLQSRLSPLQKWLQQPRTVAASDAFKQRGALARTPLSQWTLTPSCRRQQMDAKLEEGACGMSPLLRRHPQCQSRGAQPARGARGASQMRHHHPHGSAPSPGRKLGGGLPHRKHGQRVRARAENDRPGHFESRTPRIEPIKE